tara:strand:+ start:18 stop:671 length:654 start_codon:yes stop_codon:yes gene_type:complete
MNNKKKLPDILPIFPLSNFIFFPKTSIPLNIFEPRYIQMINDSLKKDRVIGLIQPKFKKNIIDNNKPDLYSIGCAGKITSFNETKDKRIILVLNGISRFKILKEIPINKLYRQCKVEFKDFKEDLIMDNLSIKDSTQNLIFNDFKIFFQKKGYEIDWKELEKQNLNQAINSLCMIAPFSLEEKQILLETKNINDRKIKIKEILNTYILSDINIKTIQ